MCQAVEEVFIDMIMVLDVSHSQGRRWKFVAGGLRLGSLGDGSPPVGSRREAPVGGLGDEVPQKLKHFLKNRYQFL